MIVTQSDARKIIAQAYGADFKIRLTVACTVGVRPVWQHNLGMVTLAWRKLAVDSYKGIKANLPSAVKIGRMLPTGAIDWDYEIPMPAAPGSIAEVNEAQRKLDRRMPVGADLVAVSFEIDSIASDLSNGDCDPIKAAEALANIAMNMRSDAAT